MADKKGFDLAGLLKDVSKLDTEDRAKLEYIDIDLIDADPANRPVSGIDELAENIALVGLQQPLSVRANPDAEGRYIAVSGHRRREAIKKLVSEGEEQYRMTPCLVAAPGESAAMIRLKLLSGNIVTQGLSSAEMAQAAEDMQQCIYDLKKEGYEFPGRVRDYVANAMQVSTSKLARLKVIRDNLIDNLKKDWEKGELSESVAYAFAQHGPEVQQLTVQQLTGYGTINLSRKYWNEYTVKHKAEVVEKELKPKKGPRGSCDSCDAAEMRLKRLACGNKWDDHCGSGKCCHDCPNLGICEFACQHLSGEVTKAKEAAKAKRAAEKEEKHAQDEKYIAPSVQLWKRFGEARAAAGLTFEEYAKKANVGVFRREKKVTDFEQGRKITPSSGGLPYAGGDGVEEWRIRPLINAADALGCSIDYLLCRTDDPRTVGDCWEEAASADPCDDISEALDQVATTEEPVCRICWESRGRTPPAGKLILTYQMTNNGPEYRPAVWDGSKFQSPDRRKELTGLQYTHWLEVPLPGSGESCEIAPPEQAEGQLMICGWMPGGTFPTDDCEVVADFDLGDGTVVRQNCFYVDGHFTFRVNSGDVGARIDMEAVRWMRLPPVD